MEKLNFSAIITLWIGVICWFEIGALETFLLLSILKSIVLLNIFMETVMHYF